MNRNRLLQELIARFQLNLDGLNVYTEAASGHYAYCPVLAALAGATRVIAQAKDSRFGAAVDVISASTELAELYGVRDRIEYIGERSYAHLACADIVTNSGHVRPIDRALVDALKPTAVIPLMWETWEFRGADFDLTRCRERGILVLGTNEHQPPCDMRSYVGLTGLKLALELEYDGGPVLVLGNSLLLGAVLNGVFRHFSSEVTWVSDDPQADLPYSELSSHFVACGEKYTHLIVAEHQRSTVLIGENGLLKSNDIAFINPGIRIGVICGNVNVSDLSASGIQFLPEVIAPFGVMSYQPAVLGLRPVLTLFSAGLKVGERMARARLLGHPPDQAIRAAMQESPAMEFTSE